MMILYHFTCGRYLRGIARHGLTVGDVPVDIDKNTGTVAVWLTASLASDGHGLEGSAINKMQYRLGVEVSDADPRLAKWTEWASKNATARTIAALRAADGDGDDSWWVYFGCIPPSAITCVETSTGAEISDWGNASPAALDLPGVPYWNRHAWHRQLLKKVARASSRTRTIHLK
jgi:hypothetical protein